MKLRRMVAAFALTVALSLMFTSNARAVTDYDDSETHPLRLVAYAIHPIAFVAEWLITRPFHRLVSQDDMAPIFGHAPHPGFDYETYQEGLGTGVSFEQPYTKQKRRY